MKQTFEQGHALIIGVGADLPNTVDDAIGMANILKDGERCAYPAGQVHLLTSEGATRQAYPDGPRHPGPIYHRPIYRRSSTSPATATRSPRPPARHTT